MTKIFISHSSQDRDFVARELLDRLQKHELQTWHSEEDIHSAEQWDVAIRQGLEACEWFLLVTSPRSAKSEWVRNEDWLVQVSPRFVRAIRKGRDSTGWRQSSLRPDGTL